MTAQTRRSFLATLGTAAIGTTLSPVAALAQRFAARPLARIGLQLYTVRAAMAADLPGTLEQVAKIGYREVEFAGYFGRSPREISQLLSANGLTSPSSHIPIAQLLGDWKKALGEAREIGHGYVTIPWLQASQYSTADSWKRLAEQFNRGGAEAKEAGLCLAYHNHDFEFRTIDGIVPFDFLLAETDPALVSFQIDLYWMVRAGRDPLQYLERHPGRFKMVHVKDSAGAPDHRMTHVGGGSIDFRTILARAQKAGVDHYFVEHDQPSDPMASIRASHAYLSGLEL
jgi:sugar phosphate isomerase/epimerase